MRILVLALLFAGCNGPIVTMIDPSAAHASQACAECPTFDGAMWDLGKSTAPLRYPVPVIVGVTITEWSVTFQRDALGPATTVRLQRLETVSGLHSDVGPAITDRLQGPGYVSIGAHISPDLALEDWTYSLLVTGGGVDGDHAGAAVVYGQL